MFSLRNKENNFQYLSGGLIKLLKKVNKWASSRESLSSGFPSKLVSNQSPQLQRLARKLKFHK